MSQPPLGFFRSGAYGMTDLGVGIFVTVKQVLLAPFMTQYLGIPAELAATIVLSVLLLDILTDPIVGWLSDNTRSRLGRRLPYILIGAPLMAIATYMLFSPPAASAGADAAWWIFGFFILATLGYTLIIIPHGSLTADATPDPIQRSKLTGWRMVWFSVGVLIAGGVLPDIIKGFGGDRAAHGQAYLLMVPVIIIAALITIFAMRAFDKSQERASTSPISQLKAVFSNTRFLMTMILFSIQLFGFGLMSGSIVYFSEYLVADDGTALTSDLTSEVGVFSAVFGILTLSGMIAQPFWTWVSARFGKRFAYTSGMVAYGLIMLAFASSLPFTNMDLLLFGIFLVGICYGCLLQLPWALLPDLIDAKEGPNSNLVGAYNAYWLLGQKLANATAPSFILFMLGRNGWQESTQGFVDQPQQALDALAMVMTYGPAAIFISTALVYMLLDRQMTK